MSRGKKELGKYQRMRRAVPVFAFTEYVTYLQMIKLKKTGDSGEEREMEAKNKRRGNTENEREQHETAY